MKLFIGFLVVIICLILGNLLSLKYSERKRFYRDFCDFNERLIQEVAYSQNTINHLLNDCPSTCFYQSVKNNILEKKSLDKVNFLTENEFDFFKDYLSKLGKSDKSTQLNFLTYSSSGLYKLKNDSEGEEKKYKSLYLKMSFLIGLIILIILL